MNLLEYCITDAKSFVAVARLLHSKKIYKITLSLRVYRDIIQSDDLPTRLNYHLLNHAYVDSQKGFKHICWATSVDERAVIYLPMKGPL